MAIYRNKKKNITFSLLYLADSGVKKERKKKRKEGRRELTIESAKSVKKVLLYR